MSQVKNVTYLVSNTTYIFKIRFRHPLFSKTSQVFFFYEAGFWPFSVVPQSLVQTAIISLITLYYGCILGLFPLEAGTIRFAQKCLNQSAPFPSLQCVQPQFLDTNVNVIYKNIFMFSACSCSWKSLFPESPRFFAMLRYL